MQFSSECARLGNRLWNFTWRGFGIRIAGILVIYLFNNAVSTAQVNSWHVILEIILTGKLINSVLQSIAEYMRTFSGIRLDKSRKKIGRHDSE